MSTHKIPYSETGYFSKLICDYLDQDENLSGFYGHFPTLENFKSQIENKNFSAENREVLVSALRKQYEGLEQTPESLDALELLALPNTYTVTTGHQLNLFTGPLYFLYKIISTITLSRKLKETYPDSNFVPVYWMATEDHDFDEINYFRLHGKKIQWNREDISNNDKGAVGALNNGGLDAVYERLQAELGTTRVAQELAQLFKSAYLKHNNLAEATRFLAHGLFGEYGLVIVDGNDHDLKAVFAPYMKQ